MINAVTVLGCLLLVCNSVTTAKKCLPKDICSKQNCYAHNNKIKCDGCETKDFNSFCEYFKENKRSIPCTDTAVGVLSLIIEHCKTNDGDNQATTGTTTYRNGDDNEAGGTTTLVMSTSANDSSGKSQRTTGKTIVIAVCVSVVVVVLAVLLTGVYCWRVRRGSNSKRNCEDFELRNNARTNDAYKMDNGPFSSRPGSTYNTIDDLQREHEYNTLEPQNSIPKHVERNQRTVDLQREHAYHTLEPQNSIPTNVERNQRTVDLQREHAYHTLEPQNSIPTHVERNQRTVDLQREHAYHTLEPPNSLPTHVERNKRTVDSVDNRKPIERAAKGDNRKPIEPAAKGDNRKPIEPAAKGDSDSNNAYDDGEYNIINYNKRPETTSDPSYSHLGSIKNESDYNTSEAETISKTSTYTYGVPIKIKDLPNTKPTDTQTRPSMKVPNGADDGYVIPKKDLEEHPNVSDEKPKAIVNPLNFNESGGYSASNSEDNSAEVTIEDTKKDTNDHVTDGYEEARIVKVESTGNTDNEITKIELPRVQIGKITEDKPNDGYETAAIMQTKAAVNDGVHDSEMVKDMQIDMTDLNSSGSSVIIEPKINRNDGYETARICQ